MGYAKALTVCAAFVVSASTAGVVASPASAKGAPILVNAPPEDMAIRRVSYADLNISTEPGHRALVSRVKYAVNDLCQQVAGGYDGAFMFNPAQSRCTSASWQQAQPQIESAVLRARQIAETGRSSIAAAALTITVPADR